MNRAHIKMILRQHRNRLKSGINNFRVFKIARIGTHKILYNTFSAMFSVYRYFFKHLVLL